MRMVFLLNLRVLRVAVEICTAVRPLRWVRVEMRQSWRSAFERAGRRRGVKAFAVVRHVANEIMHMSDVERRDVSARDRFAQKGECGECALVHAGAREAVHEGATDVRNFVRALDDEERFGKLESRESGVGLDADGFQLAPALAQRDGRILVSSCKPQCFGDCPSTTSAVCFKPEELILLHSRKEE